MRIAFIVGLAAVAGCSGDFGVETAALKGGNSCHIAKDKVDRGAINPANPCQVCKPDLDDKGWSSVADGTACDDGNACTRSDACQAGRCTGGAPVVCAPLDECHFAGTCDPHSGVCSNPPRSDCGGVPPTSAVIGSSGGTLTTTNGTSIEIPPGAIDADTVISVAESSAPPPSGIGAVTPVFDFGPDGIVFAHPVKITIPLASTAGPLSVWWTNHDGSGTFEPIGGSIVGNSIVVDVTHFSSGVVAADLGFRNISGTDQRGWVSSTTYQLRHVDLTNLTVEALIPNGAGGYTPIGGSGTSEGLFEIKNVPDGPVLVHVGNLYTLINSASWVDLTSARMGRFDQTVASDNTALTFNVSGMTKWQDGDQLEFFSTQVDTWFFDIEQYGVPGEPAPGDTGLSGLQILNSGFDSNGQPAHLIQGSSHGDLCTLAHLQARPSMDAQPVIYQAMIETLTPSPAFDEPDGVNFDIDGVFQLNKTQNVVSIDVKPNDFYVHANSLPEGAVRAGSFTVFGIGGVATNTDRNIFPSGATADFLLLDLSSGLTDDAHIVASGMTYGQPLAGSWYSSGEVVSRILVQHTLPDAPDHSVIYPQSVATSFQVSGTDPSTKVITVNLSQPTSPLINGLSLLHTQSGFGATPTISWSPPAVGTPDFYTIVVSRIVNNGGGTFKADSVSLATRDTSLTLPTGIMTPGWTYVINLGASHAVPLPAGAEKEATAVPFTGAPAGDFANIISAIVTP